MQKVLRISIYAIVWTLIVNVTSEQIRAKEKVVWPTTTAKLEANSKDEIARILLEHRKWVETRGKEGQKANLTGANLRGIDLREANLSKAILMEANLSRAVLAKANLSEADLTKANLSEADLTDAKLKGAFLTSAKLRGTLLTKADLAGAILRRADLRNAVLREADLTGAVLREADMAEAFLLEAKLKKADLSYAGLKGADLTQADMKEVSLIEADLSFAKIQKANLQEAKLEKAKLSQADLTESDLTGANLNGADLSGAALKKIKLNGAILTHTNLRGSYFEPETFKGLLFLGAKGFSTIEFMKFSPIVSLRNLAKISGLRNEERALTAALRKYRLNAAPLHEKIFEYMLIDLATDSGANPWRCLVLLFIVILMFPFIYNKSLKSDGTDGIWKVWIQDRIRKDLGSNEPVRLSLTGFAGMRFAFYFSFLSAFSIGWRELNVGYWISRLQRREFTLRPTGWMRTLSGFQSLISVYFLALWALTYFGRPFE